MHPRPRPPSPCPCVLLTPPSSHMLSHLSPFLHPYAQELRETIVPSARAYPLHALLDECSHYYRKTGRRVTFEYTLLSGVNDSDAHVSNHSQ